MTDIETFRRCCSCRSTKPTSEFYGKRDTNKILNTCSFCRSPARMIQRTEAVKRHRDKKKQGLPSIKIVSPEERKENRKVYMRDYMRQRAKNNKAQPV